MCWNNNGFKMKILSQLLTKRLYFFQVTQLPEKYFKRYVVKNYIL